VREPAWAAAEVKKQIRTHQPPTQTGAELHCRVDVRDARDVLFDQIHDLAVQGGLQAIADVPFHLFLDVNRAASHLCVEREGPLYGLRTGLGAPHDLDERNQVGRSERVPDKGSVRRARSPIECGSS